mgnify:CR=1 FL=1
MSKPYEDLGQVGWIFGWIPASIVLITVRYTVFGTAPLSDTTEFLGIVGGGAIWLLCGLVGNLLDKNQRTKEEMQSLKDRVDRLDR